MHAKGIVGLMLKDCLSGLHEKRAEALCAGVSAAVSGGRLSLSGLAHRVGGSAALRHRIKRIDRLIGNDAIHQDRSVIYSELAARWLSDIGHTLIVVDWSDLTRDQSWHLLRASVAVEGRSVTLYEEVHPRNRLGSRWVHQRFLGRLERILPAGCKPILLTDAGFRSSWFDTVDRRHWQWIGRIRNRDLVCVEGAPWKPAKSLYALAGEEPQEFHVRHVRNHPATRRMVLVKRLAKGRVSRTRFGKRRVSKVSLAAGNREREPWLLACSSGLAHLSPAAIVALYAQRMRIEQEFRDTKNERLGMGLHAARSRSAQRFEMLLLIGHLAAWLLRLIGEGAQQRQMTLQFQSTGRTARREISVMTLASRVVEFGLAWLTPTILRDSLARLRLQARGACLAS